MEELSVVALSGRALRQVFGASDEHLRKIRKALGVRVSLDEERGKIIVRSESQENARRCAYLLEKLQRWVDRDGAPLSPDDVGRALDEVARGEQISATVPFEVYGGKTIRAKTAGQAKYCEALREREILFCAGPAGTGKTYLASARAVEALRTGEARRIVLVRPAVEAGENLGFLPGDLAEKINPYLRPLFDSLADMTQADLLRQFIEDSRVEIAPLAYMRGRTLNDAYIILDEAQNTTIAQMKMFLTRMGYNSRVVVCGDATQSDLSRSVRNGFVDAFERLRGVSEIGFMTLGREDIVRHALVQKIVDAYEKDFGESEYVDGRAHGDRRPRVMSVADAFAETRASERRQEGEASEETAGLDAPADEVSAAKNSNASTEGVRDPLRGF